MMKNCLKNLELYYTISLLRNETTPSSSRVKPPLVAPRSHSEGFLQAWKGISRTQKETFESYCKGFFQSVTNEGGNL